MAYIVRDSSRSPSPELCADSVDSDSNLNNSAVAEVASVQGGKEGSGDTNSNSTAIEHVVVLINRANVLLEKVLAMNINNNSTSAGTQTPATAATTTQVSGNSGSATSKKGATGGQAGSTSSSARFAAASAYASTAAKVLARSNLVPGRSQYKGYNYPSDSSSSSSSNDDDDGLVFWKLKSTPSTSAGYGYVDDSSTLKRYLSHDKGVHQLVPLKPAAPIKATTTAAATMAEGVALNLSRSGGGARASSAANTAEEANMIKVSKTTTESKAVPTGSTHTVDHILGKSSSSSNSGPQKPPMPPGPPPPSPSLDALTDQMKKRMKLREDYFRSRIWPSFGGPDFGKRSDTSSSSSSSIEIIDLGSNISSNEEEKVEEAAGGADSEGRKVMKEVRDAASAASTFASTASAAVNNSNTNSSDTVQHCFLLEDIKATAHAAIKALQKLEKLEKLQELQES